MGQWPRFIPVTAASGWTQAAADLPSAEIAVGSGAPLLVGLLYLISNGVARIVIRFCNIVGQGGE